MNMKFFATTAAAAVLLAAPAMAATYTFDNFTTTQTAFDSGNPTSTAVGGPTSGFQGTSRDFLVENSQPSLSGFPAATTLTSGGGVLAFDNDVGSQGKASLTYNGVGDLMANVNNGAFLFNVLQFDGNAEFMLIGSDNSGGTLTYSETLANIFSPVLKFSDILGSDTFNFGDVASLTFSISSTATNADSIDGALSSIEISAVPVPASGLLLLGAFGGVAALRRRKAKKAA